MAKNPHHTLTALYNKILRAVSKMPQEAAYRRYTEQIVSQRAKIVASVRTLAGHTAFKCSMCTITGFVLTLDPQRAGDRAKDQLWSGGGIDRAG